MITGKDLLMDTGGQATKKLLVVLFVIFLVVGVLTTASCINTDKDTEQDTEVVNLDEDVNTGILGTFVNGSDTVTFAKGGTFTISGPAGSKSGTYKVQKAADGSSKVILTYPDAGLTQIWSFGISNGKVVAVTNPNGEQWNKK